MTDKKEENIQFLGLAELTTALANKRNILKADAKDIVDDFIEVLQEELLEEDNRGLLIANFLTLEKVRRNAKPGRDPLDVSRTFVKPAWNSFRIRLGKEFSEKYNQIEIRK